MLFLDICGFSTIDSGDEAEQDRVFTLLVLFMGEMLQIVKAHEGSFKKTQVTVSWPTLAISQKRSARSVLWKLRSRCIATTIT